MAIGKYIYGILNSNVSFHLSIPKPPHQLELKEDYPGNWCGGKSNGVYSIPYQDISALVKDSEIVDITHMYKDILARLLIEHQTVIERVMTAQATIIPMRLGTFALDETEVNDILSKGYNLIKEIFERINDKIEIDVVATWSDLNSIIKEAGEQKEIKEFKEKLLSNPKGITADDQMKIGFMVKEALDRIRETYACKIQGTLKIISGDFRVHELMDNRMVINIAYLVDKAKYKDFERIIDRLNADFNEKLNFKCVGPLPCYSFYTLEIKKMNFTEVDWARKRLGFSKDSIMKDEIKIAYHREAFIHHPDKNPERIGTEKEFEEIKKSYDVLIDFAQACSQAGSQTITFREDKFNNNAVLVKIRE